MNKEPVQWEISRGMLSSNRDVPKGQDTIFCSMLDLELLDFTLPEPDVKRIKESFELCDANIGGDSVRAIRFKEGGQKEKISRQYGQKRASFAADREGNIYFYSLQNGSYVLDSRLRDPEDIRIIFNVLEEKGDYDR